MPSSAAELFSKGCTLRPVQLRSTLPVAISSSETFFARFDGMAPPRLPMPTSFTPTISPLRLTSGPPEFPGKITASWPIQRTISPTASPSSRIAPPGEIISVFATIPCVTDWEMPAGLPIASTMSPTSSAELSPNFATGSAASGSRSAFLSILRTARSASGSVPTNVAGISCRSDKRTVTRVARPATWWLVRI